MGSKSIKEDINELKESTVRLGRQLLEVTGAAWTDSEKYGEIHNEMLAKVNRGVKEVREKIGDVASNAAEQSRKFQETIRRKPYLFLAGTLGVGIVLGRFLDWKRKRV